MVYEQLLETPTSGKTGPWSWRSAELAGRSIVLETSTTQEVCAFIHSCFEGMEVNKGLITLSQRGPILVYTTFCLSEGFEIRMSILTDLMEHLDEDERDALILHEEAHVLHGDLDGQKGILLDAEMEIAADKYAATIMGTAAMAGAINSIIRIMIDEVPSIIGRNWSERTWLKFLAWIGFRLAKIHRERLRALGV